jgi:hypothetical protein
MLKIVLRIGKQSSCHHQIQFPNPACPMQGFKNAQPLYIYLEDGN